MTKMTVLIGVNTMMMMTKKRKRKKSLLLSSVQSVAEPHLVRRPSAVLLDVRRAKIEP